MPKIKKKIVPDSAAVNSNDSSHVPEIKKSSLALLDDPFGFLVCYALPEHHILDIIICFPFPLLL